MRNLIVVGLLTAGGFAVLPALRAETTVVADGPDQPQPVPVPKAV